MPRKNINLPSTPPFLWGQFLFPPCEESRPATREKKATLQRKTVPHVFWRQTIFFPICLWYFILPFGFIFCPPNLSNQFLFGSMLVPAGCLSLAAKVQLQNHVLRGRDKDSHSNYQDGKAITAWCACTHLKIDWMEVPQNTKHRAAIWLGNPTPGHISRQNPNSKTYTHPYVHSSTIHNSQDMETI